MKKSYHSIMVPTAEAKITRQMQRLENWWVPTPVEKVNAPDASQGFKR
jgi:hypothetical protein